MARFRIHDEARLLDMYESASARDKCVIGFAAMQLGLFRILLTCEQTAKIVKDGCAGEMYSGRGVCEVLDDLHAKLEAALHVLADEKELEQMRRMSGLEGGHA